MKHLLVGILLFTSYGHANSIEEARELFSMRSNTVEGVANAKAAGDMYKALAEAASSEVTKAELKVLESEAIYFVSNRIVGKSSILESFERAYNAANFAQSKLEGSDKANALYWYAASQGRWGETKGILSSLSRWKGEMKPALELALNLDQTVQQYGIIRILGKAFLKVPGEDKNKGMEYLTKAYINTLVPVIIDEQTIETSKQVNNTIFMLFGAYKTKTITKEVCTAFSHLQRIKAAGVEAMIQIDGNEGLADVEKALETFFGGEDKDYKKTTKILEKKCK